MPSLSRLAKLGADEASIMVQHSDDLKNWITISTAILSQELMPDGLGRKITVELPEGASGFGRPFSSDE